MEKRKVWRRLVVVAAVAVVLGGCSSPSNGGATLPDPDRYFWTVNMAKDYLNDPSGWLQVGANLVKEGTRCVVYLENGASVSQVAIDAIAAAFDTSIWDTVTGGFSSPTDRDSNTKVILFLLDIRDSYNPPTFTGYTGGYFYAVDLYSNSELAGLGYPGHFKSNEAEILYIDINPADPLSTESKSVVTYEFQHLVSASQNVIREAAYNLPTWINEGFSMAAESIYQGVKILSSRETWYDNDPLFSGAGGVTRDPGKSISLGYPLVLWNIYPSNGYAVFNNYAQSHLFFAWLRIHMGSDDFFKTIHNSDVNTVQAVIDVCSLTLGSTVDTFPKMLRTWRMANLLSGNPTGLESYLDLNTHTGPYKFNAPGGAVGIYASGAIHYYDSAFNGWSPSGGDAQISYALGNTDANTSDYTAPFGTGLGAPEVMMVLNTESTGYTGRNSAALPTISLPPDPRGSAEAAAYFKTGLAGTEYVAPKSLPFSAFRKGREPVGTDLPVPHNRLK